LNSREVLDFNLYLSPYDVWTAKVTADAAGGGKIVVADKSCTAPAISVSNGGTGEQAFFTYGFDGSNVQAADAEATRGLARTREGYIELIEMGDIDPLYVLPNAGNKNFLNQITHSGGVLPSGGCAAVNTEWAAVAPFPGTRGLNGVSGGLAGTGTLINVAAGTDYSYDPTPLAGYTATPNHTDPGNLQPSLADAVGASQVVLVDQVSGGATVANTNWAVLGSQYGGIDAVSAALMRSAVIDEYIVNTAIHAGTDWVVTMPTKKWYVDPANFRGPLGIPAGSTYKAVRPFSNIFVKDGACETIGLAFYDQEEQKPTGTIGFSPAPAGKSQVLCWEANVVTFNNSNVLSSNQTGQNVNVGNYPAGWLSLTFPLTPALTSNIPTAIDNIADVVGHQMGAGDGVNDETYQGLPVIGFSVQKYVNDVLVVNGSSVLSNYGGNFAHKYQRTITKSAAINGGVVN
jgi:hypothetical protein